MVKKHVHIVSPFIPRPSEFPEANDLFYLIAALHKEDTSVTLHHFIQDDSADEKCFKFCDAIFSYSRNEHLAGHSLPVLMQSFVNKELEERLLSDQDPIIFSGISCTYMLNFPEFLYRRIFIRMLRDEVEYYRFQKHFYSGFFRRRWIDREATGLRKHMEYLGCRTTFLVPPFLQNQGCVDFALQIELLPVLMDKNNLEMDQSPGMYCLYEQKHNFPAFEKDGIELIRTVINPLHLPLVVVGHQVSASFQKFLRGQTNTCFVEGPPPDQVTDLRKKAQLNIILGKATVATDVLGLLRTARQCISTSPALNHSQARHAIHVVKTLREVKQDIGKLYQEPVEPNLVQDRTSFLEQNVNSYAEVLCTNIFFPSLQLK